MVQEERSGINACLGLFLGGLLRRLLVLLDLVRLLREEIAQVALVHLRVVATCAALVVRLPTGLNLLLLVLSHHQSVCDLLHRISQ